MDFLVVGLIIGGTIVLASLLVHDLLPHLAPARHRRAPRTPTVEAELGAWTRLCRLSGAILAGAGALVLAATIGALALNVSDGAGSLIVAGSVMAALAAGGVGIFISLRRYSDTVAMERSVVNEMEPVLIASPASTAVEPHAGPVDDLFDDVPLWSPEPYTATSVPLVPADPTPALDEDYWPAWNERTVEVPEVAAIPVVRPIREEPPESPGDSPSGPSVTPIDVELADPPAETPLWSEPADTTAVNLPVISEPNDLSEWEQPLEGGGQFASPLLSDIGLADDDVEVGGAFRSSLLSDLLDRSDDDLTNEGADDQLLGEAPAPLPGGNRGRNTPHPDQQ